MAVSEQIIQVLNALCEKFGLVIDWTSENVVPYLGELCGKLVNYEIWTSVAWMVPAVLMIVISVVVLCVLRKRMVEAIVDYDCWPIPVILGIAVAFVAGICVIGCQINDIIKCVTFPELYVFEYVKHAIECMG